MIAVVALTVILLIWKGIKRRRGDTQKASGGIKSLLIGGFCCGTVMCIAASLQQIGLGETDAGKASFITAMYLVLVPILGLFLRRRTSIVTAVSVAISVVGLYLLCVSESFSIQGSDVYILLCALCFAIHILVIDHFAPKTDGIALSLVQFIVMAAESAVAAAIFERPTGAGILMALGQILYVGIFSSGVAFTLQILAQKDSDPTVVTLLLSLESVFGAIAGAIILHEVMSGREYLGCALMLCAVLLSQIPVEVWKKLFKKRTDKI
jgi:drug/metabolite transporter (DMT)-like permease